MHDSNEYKIQDMQNLIVVKENSLKESIELVTDKELEIQRCLKQLREAEEAIREHRQRSQDADEEAGQYQ